MPCRAVFEYAKYFIPKTFVKGTRLKIERIQMNETCAMTTGSLLDLHKQLFPKPGSPDRKSVV